MEAGALFALFSFQGGLGVNRGGWGPTHAAAPAPALALPVSPRRYMSCTLCAPTWMGPGQRHRSCTCVFSVLFTHTLLLLGALSWMGPGQR